MRMEAEARTEPQPERREPKLAEPTPTDLSKRDWMAIFTRAGKESMNDHVTNLAAALAYYAFLAIPAVLLVAVASSASSVTPTPCRRSSTSFEPSRPRRR